ncbi:hypothetical protein [uncultured Tenacibaculum sp.]|nr:hypothetical protein [uncultured Tenacibaculum sp.]
MLENLKQFKIEKEQLVNVFGGCDTGGGDTGTGDGDFYCDETTEIC